MESLYSGLSCFALICANDDSGICVGLCVGGGGGGGAAPLPSPCQ